MDDPPCCRTVSSQLSDKSGPLPDDLMAIQYYNSLFLRNHFSIQSNDLHSEKLISCTE